MSPEQVKIVDDRLAKQGMYKGNIGSNRIDLPRRFHESSKHEGYEGAHQVTKREGIDSRAELDRIRALSPEQRFNELDSFIDKQTRHRRVGQQKYMQQHQLEPGNNSTTNAFGGNFSQAVLQNRNKTATLKAGQALKAERLALPPATRALSGASAEILKIGKGLIGNVKKLLTSSASKQITNRMPVGTGQMDEDLMTISEKLRIVPIEPYSMPRHLL